MTLAVPPHLPGLCPYLGTLEHWNKTAFFFLESSTCGVPTKKIVWNKWNKRLGTRLPENSNLSIKTMLRLVQGNLGYAQSKHH